VYGNLNNNQLQQHTEQKQRQKFVTMAVVAELHSGAAAVTGIKGKLFRIISLTLFPLQLLWCQLCCKDWQ
jgi:hypothetical protein